ncbi:MAG: sigma-70 family RNA polymerase sigma factor [Chloroflexota bacterium]
MQTSSQTEITQLAAARSGDSGQFAELAEPYRRELRAYCYRLLGSLEDAEDLVQETMLRAWRRLETFEGRASFRAWLYKIATNACLDALEKASRRGLPITSLAPTNPQDALPPASSEPLWLDPFPDDWLDDTTPSPEARYTLQESVTLAFLTALQVLPPHQRTVLVLRDVLDWQASEVADFLDMTVSAVNSALHRARSTLSKQQMVSPKFKTIIDDDNETRALLERYVRAWEEVDVAALVALLKEDATFSMPPFPAWFHTREAIAAFFTTSVFAQAIPCRLLPIHVNGQPGFANYQYNGAANHYQAHSIHVLVLDGEGIASLTAFLDPTLFTYFGLPDDLSADK